MSEQTGNDKEKSAEEQDDAASTASASDETTKDPGAGHAGSGPSFEETPDPLAGVRRFTRSAWASMDGKSVSMRTYVGTIVGVVILMMLARCGG